MPAKIREFCSAPRWLSDGLEEGYQSDKKKKRDQSKDGHHVRGLSSREGC
jgi:hypothetical protein